MMGYNKDSGTSIDVDRVLNVISNLSVACGTVGVASVICGALTLVYADPVWEFPFSTGSGIWAGVCIILLGALGFYFTRIHNKSFPSSSIKWVNGFRGLAHVTCSLGGLHFGYSIAGLTTCVGRSTRDDGVEKCNADEHDRLLIVQALGVTLGAIMLGLGIFSLIYILTGKRGAALTGNERYGQCGECNSM